MSKCNDWLTEDSLKSIESWARDGLTDKQIAEQKMGIAYSTFKDWKVKFSDFSAALKRGKAPVDADVENSLLKSALGYRVTVKEPIKIRTVRQKHGEGRIEEEHVEYVDKEIYIPANTTAQIFWLKNRKPEKWRDKPKQTDANDSDEFEALVKIITNEVN